MQMLNVETKLGSVEFGQDAAPVETIRMLPQRYPMALFGLCVASNVITLISILFSNALFNSMCFLFGLHWAELFDPVLHAAQIVRS